MIFDDFKKVYELAIAYIGNGRYFAFAVASLLFLFVTSKKIRPRLIYPTMLLILIIGTPWLYHYVFNRDAYWRTFWMFPMTIFIAVFCVRLIQACQTIPERIGMTVVLVLVLVFMGTNMYTAERTKPNGEKERILTEATNPEKVSKGAKEVADLLLTIEDEPKVITRKKYVYELRQYSSKIKLFYGRDIDGFIIGPVNKGWRVEVHKNLESSSPNYNRVLQIADKSGYNFLITSSQYRINDTLLDRYGYREIAILDGSAVYYKEVTFAEQQAEAEAGSETSDESVTGSVADNSEEAIPDTSDSIPADTSEGAPVDASEETILDSSITESVSEDSGDSSDSEEAGGVEILQEFAAQS